MGVSNHQTRLWHSKAALISITESRFFTNDSSGSEKRPDRSKDFKIVQFLGRSGPERLSVSQQTLHQRLRESGLLASIDQGRQMVQVRRTLEGSPRQVLHLRAQDLVGEFEKLKGTPAEELI